MFERKSGNFVQIPQEKTTDYIQKHVDREVDEKGRETPKTDKDQEPNLGGEAGVEQGLHGQDGGQENRTVRV